MRNALKSSEKEVLRAFRSMGQASKAEISRRVDLTHPAVAQVVKGLCDLGYLDEHTQKRKGMRGQPATIYSIADKNIFIGIHVGRQTLEFVALGLTGKVLASLERNVGFLEKSKLKAACQPTLDAFLSDKRIAGRHAVGVGISTPFFWSSWQSILPSEGEADPDWNWEQVSTLFEFPQGIPVLVENDGSASALAELTFGAGSRHRDFLYVNIGTFIGGGLIIDGTLRTGTHHNSAAIGPFPVAHSTLSRDHNATGPFELLLGRASLYALTEHAKRRGIHVEFSSWPTDDNPEIIDVIDEWIVDCAKALAQFVIGVWSLIDVEAIVFDGAVPKPVLQRIVDVTQEQIRQYEIEGIIASEIKVGDFGAIAQSIGAACLPILRIVGPPETGSDND